MQCFRHILVLLFQIAAISGNFQTVRTPEYGGAGGISNQFTGHGKITGIKHWGLINGHVAIHTVYAENQEYPIWFGPHYGSGCSSFTLGAGDEINGYRVYYDGTGVYGITFHTKNGAEHSCKNAAALSGKSDSGLFTCEGYLTALFGNTDDFIIKISFDFAAGNVCKQQDAQVYFQCDNQYWIHVSNNGGNSWTKLGEGNDWTTLSEFTIQNLNSQTLVDIWCQDNGYVGGFIGTVSYQGNKYSTTNPLSNGKWHILGETPSPIFSTGLTSVSASSLVYNIKGTGAWDGHVSSKIDSQAYWVWNGKVNNVLYWRIDFAEIIGDAVPNLDPPTNFVGYDNGKNYYNINAMQLFVVIAILLFVNILCVGYSVCGKRKQFEYSKVKVENSDSEAI